MYLVVAPRLAWFQGFIACVTFLYVHLWSMLCYDYYYVLLFGMVHSSKKSSSWLAFTCVFRYFGAWVSFLVFGGKVRAYISLFGFL